MSSATTQVGFASLKGRRLGLGGHNQMVSEGKDITQPAADATILVGDENANVRLITIQLKDTKGKDIDYAAEVEITLYLDVERLAYVVTGGSTGIALGTADGALLTVVAKKFFKATTELNGDLDLKWTDTQTEVAFIGLKLPTGRIIMSTALTNA